MRLQSLALILFITSTSAFSPQPLRSSSGITVVNSSSTSSSSSSATETATIDWQTISQELFKTDSRPIVLFDGVCNLCNGGVNFALDNDSIGSLRFASLQSKAGQSLLLRSGKNPNDISSIVIVTSEQAYFKSDAVLRIAKVLDGNPFLPWLGKMGPLVPRFMRNVIYDFVADNRYQFGEADQCRLDFDNEFGSRFVSDIL